MFRNLNFFRTLLIALLAQIFHTINAQEIPPGSYAKVVEGFDWGAAVSKVIIPLKKPQESFDHQNLTVTAERKSECFPEETPDLNGRREILSSYISDHQGNRVDKGFHATLVLAVGPNLAIGSPMQYFWGKCQGTKWVEYTLEISDQATGLTWSKEYNLVSPMVDQFDLTGTFTYEDKEPLTYASFKPETGSSKKLPLIIWLHGGGEGGTDLTVPLLANKATNYASNDIQTIFEGAHVLVPQCRGAWMHNEKGVSTWGEENDIYNESLMALIRDYVQRNSDIDENRIYVGGCSNGGYMSLKLMLLYPDYFAAGFVSALAYKSAFLTDNEIMSIAHKPIWFVHSADDQVTPPKETVIPVYERLIKAGAKDVHLSLYEHVVDLYGMYGGENFWYNGHLSWIYSHANHAAKEIDGNYMTIMEWMSTKKSSK